MPLQREAGGIWAAFQGSGKLAKAKLAKAKQEKEQGTMPPPALPLLPAVRAVSGYSQRGQFGGWKALLDPMMRKSFAVARVLSGDLTKKGVVLLKSESRKTKKGLWDSEDLDGMMHAQDRAKAMKIPADHFRWYAACHNEGHHPHIHMMVWSDDPKEGFLTREGIAAMRSKLTNTIFQDEMHNL